MLSYFGRKNNENVIVIELFVEGIIDWIEEGDILFLGGYFRTTFDVVEVLYLFWPERASLTYYQASKAFSEGLRGDITLLENMPFIKFVKSKSKTLLILDLDNTIIRNRQKLKDMLELVYRIFNNLNSYEAVERGLYKNREEFFSEIWGNIPNETLIDYLETNKEVTKRILDKTA